MKETHDRRPISRRLMLALFTVMIVPVCGWYFIGDVSSHLAVTEASSDLITGVEREIRFKLAITLGVSLIVLGSVVYYVRRTILDPMERLAVQARHCHEVPWSAPLEVRNADEIGDLARALDRSVTRLQERAEQAEQFATDLSHELRTPLTAIRGAAEILTDSNITRADRDRFVGHVVAESCRLERLVSGLLDLAKAERPRSASCEPQPIRALVENALARCSSVMNARSLSVTVEGPDLLLMTDSDAVERVLTILLENTCQHGPYEGTVVVRWLPRERSIELSVEDSGDGIPLELESKVFDRWFSSGEENQKGTGLGLAIAKSLVESLGGDIRARRSSLGGALLTFNLPIRDADSDSYEECASGKADPPSQ
ncbi:MAG: HAMP domain-containing histidine kinase [bacterium]|nr:HAMP domain-containing histidine kinase [bacterium]